MSRTIRILLSGSLIFFGIVGWFVAHRPAIDVSKDSCRLTFLDVGQGDAILIQTPDHQDVVIDGGPSSDVSRQLGAYLGFGDNDIEMLILTHPDADHLTGALAILQEWPVKTILTTGVIAPTKLWQRWHDEISTHDGVVTGVQAGQKYSLGKFLTIDILSPVQSWVDIPYTTPAANGRGGINDTSIGTKITCAGSTMLAIGDASDAVEKKLLASGRDLHVDLLKAGHHGSKFSSTHDFLRAVEPDLAVVTVGAKNRYGHPHPTMLERFRGFNIPVYRTDLEGTLRFMSIPGGWRLKD